MSEGAEAKVTLEKEPARRARPWLSILAALVSTGLLVGFIGSNLASGQDANPSGQEKAKVRGLGGHKLRGSGPGHRMGGPIHGEFVVRKSGGGYQTNAMQRGEVTAVSDSSVTVKSEDGYSRTYAVTADTKVNRDGKIGDIKNGAKVGVMAVVEGQGARALRIVDEATQQQWREKMRERRQALRPGASREEGRRSAGKP